MTRYLIEVPHEATKESCELAVQAFLATGSHFVTHADWGCQDDEHKAWLIVEVENKDQALILLPPAFRNDAKVITLQTFSIGDTEERDSQHEG